MTKVRLFLWYTFVLIGFNIVYPFGRIWDAFTSGEYMDDVEEIWFEYLEAIEDLNE